MPDDPEPDHLPKMAPLRVRLTVLVGFAVGIGILIARRFIGT